MRLWSINPKYLDKKGLVALWREGLLAQAVLLGKTKGYKNHPQLERFRNEDIKVLGFYLSIVALEAKDRGYKFDMSKIPEYVSTKQLEVTIDQIEYEFKHLQDKLFKRDLWQFRENKLDTRDFRDNFEPHPLFKIVKGGIESWEKMK